MFLSFYAAGFKGLSRLWGHCVKGREGFRLLRFTNKHISNGVKYLKIISNFSFPIFLLTFNSILFGWRLSVALRNSYNGKSLKELQILHLRLKTSTPHNKTNTFQSFVTGNRQKVCCVNCL